MAISLDMKIMSLPPKENASLRLKYRLNKSLVSLQSVNTRGVQKVLQLDHKEEWKCYKLHFIFQYNHH